MKTMLAFGFMLITMSLWSVDFQVFDKYQEMFTKEELENKIKTYLEKDPQIRNFYRLTKDALYIGDLAHKEIDYTLRLSRKGRFKKKTGTYRGLQGAKIAIDPGHFGGIFAELEERFVKIRMQEGQDDKVIMFDEGTLAYLTAVELKALLEAQGAIVFLTRDKIGGGAIEEDFFSWLQKRPDLWASKECMSKIFRKYYVREDLVCRAKAINSFDPEITVIIHYNAHYDEEDVSQIATTDTNYNLTFIPGAFCAGELDMEENRYDFLRLLLTDEMDESVKLCRRVVEQFVHQLNVPVIHDFEKNSYTQKVCLKQEPGIYSRNLSLTRRIHSPLCYGETLIQNNKEELLRLSTHDTEIENVPCPSRIKEAAQAYFEGIKTYFDTK